MKHKVIAHSSNLSVLQFYQLRLVSLANGLTFPVHLVCDAFAHSSDGGDPLVLAFMEPLQDGQVLSYGEPIRRVGWLDGWLLDCS